MMWVVCVCDDDYDESAVNTNHCDCWFRQMINDQNLLEACGTTFISTFGSPHILIWQMLVYLFSEMCDNLGQTDFW